MNPRFDICIVGAGLAGCTLASSLAARKLNVALFDTSACASRGASAYSGGIVRAFDEDPEQCELATRGVLDWRETPFPIELIRQCGVFNVMSESAAEFARGRIRDSSSKDYPVVLLSAREARAKAPELNLGGAGTAVVFEPLGGTVDVKLASRLMLRSARENGATVLEHAPMKALAKTDRGIRLEGNGFDAECRIAVIAAGPWSGRWLPDANLKIRRIQLSLARVQGLDRCVIDQVRGGYCVPSPSCMVAIGSFAPPSVEDPDAALPTCAARHHLHMGLLEGLTGQQGEALGDIVGLDAYTDDMLPRVGFEDLEHAIYAFTGFSGRGAKYLPYLAKQSANALAEAIAWHAVH